MSGVLRDGPRNRQLRFEIMVLGMCEDVGLCARIGSRISTPPRDPMNLKSRFCFVWFVCHVEPKRVRLRANSWHVHPHRRAPP